MNTPNTAPPTDGGRPSRASAAGGGRGARSGTTRGEGDHGGDARPSDSRKAGSTGGKSGNGNGPNGSKGGNGRNGKRKYVTQADIAREAGVSRPLVSIALKGHGRIADDTRAHILETAERLGYIGSGIATSLAGNRSNFLIGFLANDLGNPVFIDIFEAVSSRLEDDGHRVLVMEGGIDPKKEDTHLRDLVSFRPDGVILAGYGGSTSALRAAAKAMPVVAVTRRIDGEGIDSVLADDFTGGRAATELLISRGHTDIGHLRLPSWIPYDARAEGYAAAMADAGLEPRFVEPPFSSRGAYQTVAEMISDGTLPSALFCGNDVFALGAFDAAQDAGLEVGRDLALIGYDNTDIAARVGLASVDQHAPELGRIAADILLARIKDQDTAIQERVLEPVLVDRPSAGAPHRRR